MALSCRGAGWPAVGLALALPGGGSMVAFVAVSLVLASVAGVVFAGSDSDSDSGSRGESSAELIQISALAGSAPERSGSRIRAVVAESLVSRSARVEALPISAKEMPATAAVRMSPTTSSLADAGLIAELVIWQAQDNRRVM